MGLDKAGGEREYPRTLGVSRSTSASWACSSPPDGRSSSGGGDRRSPCCGSSTGASPGGRDDPPRRSQRICGVGATSTPARRSIMASSTRSRREVTNRGHHL